MKYFEFGQQNETLMVLLHGGGVCYRGVLPVAERLFVPGCHLAKLEESGCLPDWPSHEF